MPRQHQTDHAAELQRTFDQWDHYYTHGGSDPFYPDGYNLYGLRNQILYHRRQMEENPTLFGFPEIYYRDVPPEVDRNYMARPDEIRAAAKVSLEAYRANPDYQFLLAHREEIPTKAQKRMSLGNVLGYVTGLERAITNDDLVTMRIHRNAAHYLDSFKSTANHMRKFLSEDMVSGATMALPEPEDEDFDEDLDDDFDEEPEEEFGGMTMRM